MILGAHFPRHQHHHLVHFLQSHHLVETLSTSFIMVEYNAWIRSSKRQLHFADMQKLQPNNFQTNWHPKEIPQILVVKNPCPRSQAQLSTRW